MINVKKINSRYNELCNLISSKKIKDALDILNELIAESAFSDFFVQLEHLESTYEQMLRYTLEGVHDPEREKVAVFAICSGVPHCLLMVGTSQNVAMFQSGDAYATNDNLIPGDSEGDSDNDVFYIGMNLIYDF